MGVYIPPPSDGKGDGDKPSNLQKDDNNLPKSSSSTDMLKNLLQSKLKYGVNPSFGLTMWGPLVPPPENKMALHTLSAIQFAIGWTLLFKAKNLRNKKLISMGIAPRRDLKFKKYVYMFVGADLIYNSGLELARLMAPTDPWEQERLYYKNLALKSGHPIHWWWGPQNYKPMSISQFANQVEQDIIHKINKLDSRDTKDLSKLNDNVQTNVSSPNTIKLSNISKLLNHDRFSQLYDNIYEKNHIMYDEMIEELKQVTEANKGERLADLEKQGKLRTSFTKPPIQLGNQALDTDDDLNYVWHHFEPWNELRVETDYDIRLVPKCRNFEESNDDPIESYDLENNP